MESTPSTCPPEQELVDYLLGKLPTDLAVHFESHFEDCNVCEETLRGLSATDTLSNLVEGAIVPVSDDQEDSLQCEAILQQLITKIKTTGSSLQSHDPRSIERAGEVLRKLLPSDADDSLGQLGDYQINELIGVGSTGVVFHARDNKLKRPVALKILLPSLGAEAHSRFIAEAQSAASIEHPNVVTIYQVAQANGLAFIAMQWIEGETLEERLKQVTFIPEDQLTKISKQIASGLHAAHKKNLIHRDIKPANIWLTSDNDDVRILDFGLARIADDDPHLTSTGMLAGTPNFMSPEQSKGIELDGRSDLFSLGCTMYRAATGKLPFGAGSILATLQAIQNHCPALPKQLNPTNSTDFSDLIMCLLDKHPANRPETAADLASALSSPRDQWPFVAPPANENVNEIATSPSSSPRSTVMVDSTKPAKQTQISSGFRWITGFAILAIAAWGWSTFGQQIIRVATDHGELIIETDQNDVQVEVTSTDGVVKVIDSWSQQSINLKSGEYSVHPRNKDDQPISYSVSENKIVMTRGGQQIISITKSNSNPISVLDAGSTAQPVTARIDSKTASVKLVEPTYAGKPFAHWLNLVRHERDEKTFQNGLSALGALAADSSTNLESALKFVRERVRVEGSIVDPKFDAFFGNLPAEVTVDFAINEFRNGTLPSQKNNFFLIGRSDLYFEEIVDKVSQVDLHKKAIMDRASEIIEATVSIVEESSNTDKVENAWQILMSALNYASSKHSGSVLEPATNTYGSKTTRSIPESVAKQLTKFMLSRKSTVASFSHDLATFLMTTDCYSPEAEQLVLKWINDEKISGEQLYGLIGMAKASATGSRSKWFQSLVAIFKSDSKCQAIVDYLSPFESSPYATIKAENIEQIRTHLFTQIISLNAGSRELAKFTSTDLAKKYASTTGLEDSKSTRTTPDPPAKIASNPKPNANPNAEQPSSLTSLSPADNEAVYNGNTFDQWAATMRVERNPNVIRSGLEALAILSDSNDSKQTEAIAAITPVVRQFGSRTITSNNDLASHFNKFFAAMPVNKTIDFIEQELTDGTLKSREQLIYLASPSSISMFNYDLFPAIVEGHNKNFERLFSIALKELSSKTSEPERRTFRVFASALTGSVSKELSTTMLEESAWDLKQDAESFLQSNLIVAKDSEIRAFLSNLLLAYGGKSDLANKYYCELLFDEQLPTDLTWTIYSKFEDHIDTSKFDIVEPLIRLFESDDQVNRILEIAKSRPEEMLLLGKLPDSPEYIHRQIIYKMTKAGAFYESALKFLDKLAASNSKLAKDAKDAKTLIEHLRKSKIDNLEPGVSGKTKPSDKAANTASVAPPTSKNSTTSAPKLTTKELIKTLPPKELIEKANQITQSYSQASNELFTRLTKIVRESPKFKPQAIQLVSEILAKQAKVPIVGNQSSYRQSYFTEMLIQFLNELTPEETLEFINAEITGGAPRSLTHLNFLVDSDLRTNNQPSFVFARQPVEITRFVELVRKGFPLIIQNVLDRLQKHPTAEHLMPLEIFVGKLVKFASSQKFDSWDSKPFSLFNRESKSYAKWVREAVQPGNNNFQNAIIFSSMMSREKGFAAEQVGQALCDLKMPKYITARLLNIATGTQFESKFATLLPHLTQFFESDELVGRLAEYTNQNRSEIRSRILTRIHEELQYAGGALEWLDKIADGSSYFKDYASNIAKAIREQELK